jgi:hypothetical protein
MSNTPDGAEPEVLYDPSNDEFDDDAPDGELEADDETVHAFVDTEVQDDGS